jgi:hypothetical protein
MRTLSFLALTGLALLLFGSIPITSVEEAIDTAFAVDQSIEEYYHTQIFAKSALKGEISVEGEGIYLSVNGYNSQHLKNVLIREQYILMIDPADDLYRFIFNNTEEYTECLVEFRLEEILTRPIALSSPQGLIVGLMASFFFLAGIVGLAVKRFGMMIDRSGRPLNSKWAERKI